MGWGEFWQGLKSWLPIAQAKLQESAEGLESRFSEEEQLPLSPDLYQRLSDRLTELPPPRVYRQTLHDRIAEALKQWQTGQRSLNGLAILGRPPQQLAAIVNDAIAHWPDSEDFEIQCFPSQTSRNTIEEVRQQLRETFGGESDRPTIAVIPDLGLCFLRCVEGLDAIDELQAWVSGDRPCPELSRRERFWIVGCNTWAWEYLDRVCQLSVSFEEKLKLPALQPTDLKDWLEPLCETISCQFDPESQPSQDVAEAEEKDGVWESKSQRYYFERLADRSLGCASIAARLWLRSLHRRQDREGIFIKRVLLPEPPELSQSDRFLLYAIGLHGTLTIPELAKSLGEAELTALKQVRSLERLRVIGEVEDRGFGLSPLFYPRLHSDLKNNQFLVGEEDT